MVLVRPIVTDVITKMAESKILHEQVKKERDLKDTNDIALLEKLRRVEIFLNQIEYHMKELDDVGVVLKDLDNGVVDFPCLHMGKVVYLCWQLSEKSVAFWHDTDNGFAKRRPVDASFTNTLVA